MKALLLSFFVAFIIFLNFAGAFPSQISNGDFSIHNLRTTIEECPYFYSPPNQVQCNITTTPITEYDIPSYWDISLDTGSPGQLLRDAWLNTEDFHSSPSSLELINYGTGGLYPNRFCGYILSGGKVKCGGNTGGGASGGVPANYSVYGIAAQNISFKSNHAILDFWAKAVSPSTAFNELAPAIAFSDNEYYTCTFGNTSCAYSGILDLLITVANTSQIIANEAFDLTNVWSEIRADLSNVTLVTLSQNDFTVQFTAGQFLGDNRNAVLVDDVRIIYDADQTPYCTDFCSGTTFFPSFLSQAATNIVDTSTIANLFIADHNTMTSIASSNRTGDLSFLDTFNPTAQISRNFSEFYKFNATWSVTRAASKLENFSITNLRGYDSSNNQYNLSIAPNSKFDGYLNHTTCGNSYFYTVFGYVPSNITNISYDLAFETKAGCFVGGSFQFAQINLSLDQSTITSRKGWSLPVSIGNEVWIEPFPLFYHGFLFDTVTKNITFSVYNFMNSSSYYPSLNKSDSQTDKSFLYDSSNNFIAMESRSKTYGTETTSFFSNVAFTNSGNNTDYVIMNRQANLEWFNDRFTNSSSKSTFNSSIYSSICDYQSQPDSFTCGFIQTSNNPVTNGSFFDPLGTYKPIAVGLISPAFIWLIISIVATFWIPGKIASSETNKGPYYLVLLVVFGFLGATFGIFDPVTGIIFIGLASVVFVSEIRKGFGGG